ncbi:uncharacterized protein LOC143237493 [Tachypleus tridentatus]|uniref:uncharacterized protein LOC143237493 n=1 Tax=Tachypleus tridentatus TaxID=6853 RepID=UPI003FD30CA1
MSAYSSSIEVQGWKNKYPCSDDVVCHSMPCHIKCSGPALVSNFFTSCIEPDENNAGILKSSFRGRPLHGKEIQLPEGYVGVVVKNVDKIVTDEPDKRFRMTGHFRKLTYWNWDQIPSQNDKFVKAAQWIKIAHAIHTPVSLSTKEEEHPLDTE